MTDIENYHNWLRDAHAMEKQAESLLVATIRRLDNEPQLRTRLEQHLYETRRQLSALQDIIARNHISRSALEGCDEPGGGVRTDHWHHAAR